MINTSRIDRFATRLQKMLPPGAEQLREDLKKNLAAMVNAALARMDLVTREEFEVQKALLLRTREKLKDLEARVQELEQRQD